MKGNSTGRFVASPGTSYTGSGPAYCVVRGIFKCEYPPHIWTSFWDLLYVASVFFFPHQNPAPSMAIDITANGTPTPTPIATFVAELGEPSLVVELFVDVVLVLAEVPIGTSVGSSEKVLSPSQHPLSDPQQYVSFP